MSNSNGLPTRVECLVDAFARMYGMLDPLSRAYKLRNPMMLRAFNPKHVRTEDGYRVFSNFPSGYDNGILDIKIKCSGGSRTKLTIENNLVDLVCCYGNKESATSYIVNFLRHALQDDTITSRMTLAWVIEDSIPENKVASSKTA